MQARRFPRRSPRVPVLRLLAGCAVLAHAAAASAQAPPLTRRAAIEEAMAANPELSAIRASLEAERLRPGQQHVLAPPMLDAQIWQWPIDTWNPARVTYMITAEQVFPGPGKRDSRQKLAEADVSVSAARLEARAREIVAEVRRTYTALFLARESLELTVHHIELMRQIADASQIRYAAGRAGQQDVLKSVVEISRLHEEQVVNEERVRTAEARLSALLGREPSAPVGQIEAPGESGVLRPIAELLQLALASQPELVVARAEIARAEAAVTLADRERRPDFVVRGGYMLMGDATDAITGGVGISWPNAPWSRKSLDLRRQEARVEVTAAQARYDAQVSRVRLLIQEAYVRAGSAARRAAILRTSVVPQSNQAMDISRVGYQSDRAAFFDMVDNQRVLSEVDLGYVRALAELDDARTELERLVGADAMLEAER
ncbi:MAG TPA: TolC family protein [Vicinamibacterales bacterium]|nr:TolC family protein [Vicinamibacterales bacterium]